MTSDYQIEYKTKTGTLRISTGAGSISFEGIGYEEANALTTVTEGIANAKDVSYIKSMVNRLLTFENAPLLTMVLFSWVNSYVLSIDVYIRKAKRQKKDEFRDMDIKHNLERRNIAIEILK